jgi:hypothetical protein
MSDAVLPRLSRRALLYVWTEADVELRLVTVLSERGGVLGIDLDRDLGLAKGAAGRLCGALARIGVTECPRPGLYQLAREGRELVALRARLIASAEDTPAARRALEREEATRLQRLLRAERLYAAQCTEDPGKPSAERARQGDGFEAWEGRDPEGWPASAPRAIDTVARLLDSGDIAGADARAARRFQGAFHRAQLNPLKAVDLAKLPQPRGAGTPIGERIEAAREQAWSALRALGGPTSPAARAIWFVIGGGLSIDEWARRERWGKGRHLHHTVARGIVIGGLAALRAHYEMADVARRGE